VIQLKNVLYLCEKLTDSVGKCSVQRTVNHSCELMREMFFCLHTSRVYRLPQSSISTNREPASPVCQVASDILRSARSTLFQRNTANNCHLRINEDRIDCHINCHLTYRKERARRAGLEGQLLPQTMAMTGSHDNFLCAKYVALLVVYFCNYRRKLYSLKTGVMWSSPILLLPCKNRVKSKISLDIQDRGSRHLKFRKSP
jgi:hypothetical protein